MKWRVVAAMILWMQCAGMEAEAATYRVGDVVTNNFYFVARRAFTKPDGTQAAAGSRVYLHDFAGRIVFLEWFAVWCPFCVAAAPQVRTGIEEWYASRGGNPHGAPVAHVAVNQEASSNFRAATDNFVTQQGFSPVVNDYEGNVINPVRFMFQTGGQPIFAVINGITNSPTHKPWEVLVNHLGYGQTDFSATLANFRAKIDQVQRAPQPPVIQAPRRDDTGFEFTFTTEANRSYRVQATANFMDWTTLQTVAGTGNPVLFRDANAPDEAQQAYRIVSP